MPADKKLKREHYGSGCFFCSSLVSLGHYNCGRQMNGAQLEKPRSILLRLDQMTKITICKYFLEDTYSICQLFLFFIEFFKLPLRFEQPLLTLLNIVALLSVMEAEHLALSTCNIHILLPVLALSIKQRQMESTLVAL